MVHTRILKPQLKIELFVRLIDRGYSIGKACEVAGISERTARTWLQRGQRGEAPYLEFYRRFMGGQAHMVQIASDTLLDIMLNSPNDAARARVAIFTLERAAGWMPRKDEEPDADVIDADPVDGALTPAVVAEMSPDQLVAAIREVADPKELPGEVVDPDGLWEDGEEG